MNTHFSILVVCLGNVCRSPLAERVLRMRLEDLLGADAGAVAVSSAGVRALVGSPMDQSAAEELLRIGGTPDGHQGRQLDPRIAGATDLVLTADRTLRSRVLEEAPRALKRAFTVRELAALLDGDDHDGRAQGGPVDLIGWAASWRGAVGVQDYDIVDPIGRSPEVHREVADLIDHDCTVIARALAQAVRAGSPAQG